MKKTSVNQDSEKKSATEQPTPALMEALITSEVRYRRLFESAKDGILILDAGTGMIVDVNPFLIDLLGYSKEQFIEKTIWEIGYFKDIIDNKDKFLELQQAEYVRYEDLPLETAEGRKINVEFVSNVYLVDKKRVIQCNIRDITKRKETEAGQEKTRIELAAIKKSADDITKFTENIINTVREPLIVLDNELKVIKANRSFYNFFKVNTDETIGKHIYDLGNRQWDIPKLRELLETILPEKTTFNDFEVEHNFSTIGKRVMLLNARQIGRAFGKEKIILLAIEDITERKNLEESLSEKNRMTSEYLDILLNNSHAPIIIWDSSLVIKRFNHEFEKLSGYNSNEVIDKKIDVLFPEDKIDSTLKLLNSHLNDENLEVIEIDILTKDKDIRTVLWNSANIFDKEGTSTLATIAQDITTRKRTEEALRVSEAKYRTIFENVQDVYYEVSIDGTILEISPSIEIHSKGGYLRKNLIGKSVYDFYSIPNGRQTLLALLQQQGSVTDYEVLLKNLDGSNVPCSISAKIQFGANHTPLKIIGSIRDITERKQAEEKLRESEFRFQQVSENAQELIWEVDKNGLYTYSNPIIKDLLGYELEEIIGKKHFYDFFDHEHREELKQAALGVFARKKSFKDFVNINLHKDGRKIIFSTSGIPMLNNLGNLIGYRGVDIDITERIHAEKTLLKLSSALEQTADTIVITDRHGTIEYVNPSFEDLTGYSSEEALGKTPRILKSDTKDQKYYEELWKTILSGKVFRAEVVNKKKNGDLYDEEKTISPIFDKDKNITHFVGTGVDITERKLAEKELIEALKKAKESDRLKSSFLAAMSHELRTPLNAIIGFSGFLGGNLPKDDIVEFGEIIKKSGEHLLGIVNDIFDITMIESDQTKIIKEKINLKAILFDIYRIIESEKRRIDKNEIELKLMLPAQEDIIIYTDPSKLKQILINLLKNALKFTEKGYVHYGYSTESEEGKPFLRFYVEDTGIGIPEDKREIIFDMFRQVEESLSRKYGGTGIGLSICKKLTELLGGRIWVKSEEGEGSTFYFTLSIDAPEEISKPVINENTMKNSLKGKTILVVEDDEPSFKLLKIILKSSGINTIWAKDGEESIKLCKENNGIDMVLMDINMPKMNGYEATREIKKFCPGLPIIAQTAYAVAGDREKAIEAGCDDYISKPINRVVLETMIKRHLNVFES